jgi:hypothetical protein
VRTHDGPITYITHAFQAQRYLWAFCLTCGASRRFHPKDLLHLCAADCKLDAVAKRLTCRKCGRRTAILIPSTEQFRGRN